MEIRPKYKLVSGGALEIEQTSNLSSQEGWRPMTMASLALPKELAVILESKVFEESSLTLTTALEDAAPEEVQSSKGETSKSIPNVEV